jgi:hypothetical protein
MTIVGLVGRSRVGKDTVAAALVAHGYTIRRLAQPIKDACAALYEWTPETMETDLKECMDKRWGVSPRRAMVHLTHTMRMHMGPDFFTRRLFDAIRDGENIVIPDVRYEQDIQEIHRRGGITIRITRDYGPDHEFEQHIDTLETTCTVKNNGTTQELIDKALSVLI